MASSPLRHLGDRKDSAIRALVAETLILAKTHGYADKIENELEEELRRDSKGPPKERLAKFRRKGEKFFRSKYMLLTVVILCVLDCALVLGELILDLHSVKDTLEKTENVSQNFIAKFKEKYPEARIGPSDDLSTVYKKVLQADLLFRTRVNDSLSREYKPLTLPLKHRHRFEPHRIRLRRSKIVKERDLADADNASINHTPLPGQHTLEEEIGHAFHLASITILAVLVAETILKILSFGLRFFRRKLEVFDASIVIVSFVVDLIFVNGLPRYKIQEFVFILAFLLPWRVIRVVNSLVVAVKDHEHFRLKLVYGRKKKIHSVLKQKEMKISLFQHQVECLRKLCLSEGLGDNKINRCLYCEDTDVEPKGKKGRSKTVSQLDIPNGRKSSKESLRNLVQERLVNSSTRLNIDGRKSPTVGSGHETDYDEMES